MLSGLVGLLISLVVLAGVGVLFYATIDGVAPDELLARIAKIAVGIAITIVFILAVAGALGLGGGSQMAKVSPVGIIYFAIGVVVVVVVLYLVRRFASTFLPEPISDVIVYVICAIALIALLILAANVLFGAGVGGGLGSHLGKTGDAQPFPAIERTDVRDAGIRLGNTGLPLTG